MHTAFLSTPDFKAYTAVEPLQSRTEKNPPATPLAARSARLDFREADMIDDQEMNDILYQALQGRGEYQLLAEATSIQGSLREKTSNSIVNSAKHAEFPVLSRAFGKGTPSRSPVSLFSESLPV